MSETLGVAGMTFGVFLILVGAAMPFLRRRKVGVATTVSRAELERNKREAERRFREETS